MNLLDNPILKLKDKLNKMPRPRASISETRSQWERVLTRARPISPKSTPAASSAPGRLLLMLPVGVGALMAVFFGADHVSKVLGMQTGHVVFSATCFAVSAWL